MTITKKIDPLTRELREDDGATNATSIGTLASLTTTAKTNLVDAINEVDAKVAANQAASTATDVAGLVVDHNALLVKLKAAGLMAADA